MGGPLELLTDVHTDFPYVSGKICILLFGDTDIMRWPFTGWMDGVEILGGALQFIFSNMDWSWQILHQFWSALLSLELVYFI
jgi:hypothetical protein